MDKKNIKMSATRMSTFLQCRWKYWANYVLHKPKLPNVSFKLGVAVHKALEVAGLIWKKKEKFTKYDFEKVRKTYIERAAQEGIQDLGIHDEGMSMVLDKMRSFEVGKIINVEDEFNVILSSQNHSCAICNCKADDNRNGGYSRFAIDHCHESGKVRGLLCMKCNTGIGMLDDNKGYLEKAIIYLD